MGRSGFRKKNHTFMPQGDSKIGFLGRLNEGNTDAFEEMFHYYYPSLCYFATKMVHDADEAEDIVQSVLVGFYESKPSFRNDTALRTYLYRSVNNRCLNFIEKQRKNIPVSEKQPGENPEIETAYFYQFEARVLDEIFRALETLPGKCRRIFEMSYIERLSLRDISLALDISENTVKTQRLRAKQLLRDRLRHLYPLLSVLFF